MTPRLPILAASVLLVLCVAVPAEAQLYVGPLRDPSAEPGRAAGSLVVSVLALGAGAGIGAAIGSAGPCDGLFCFREAMALTGAGLGALVMLPLMPAIYTAMQDVLGGHGHAGGAYLGWLLGALGGGSFALLGAALEPSVDGEVPAILIGGGIAAGSLLSFIGTVIGYDESMRVPRRPPPITVAPMGTGVGVSGAF